ncbi:MAG: LuxR C-terminal-related transcriptional regulator [Hyphomonadaceae bacterium]|nr:LuxR C-terminal-related transcriptional regulator [Hyphomonadaceae bacterium]
MRLAAAEALLEECQYQPERLPEAMGKAARGLGFDYFCLVSSNLARPAFIVPEEQGEGIARYFNDGWVNVDYRARTERPLPLNTLYLDHRAVGEAERKKSEIYNELFVPMRMANYAGIRFRMGAVEEWFCFVCRSEQAGVIEGQSARDFRRISELAMNIASMASRLYEERSSGMLEGLVQAGVAAVLLDRAGRVIGVTPGAESIFRADFGVRDGMLWSANSADAQSLGGLRAFAHDVESREARRRVFVQGHGRSRPVSMTALRIRGPALDQLPGAHVLVTLEDFNPSQTDITKDLHDLFGLTEAEAEVAMALHDGLDVASLAAHRDVAASTIRKQVSSIFEKLDVHRQADIVRLLSRLRR